MGVTYLYDNTPESDSISIEVYDKFYKVYVVKNVSGYYCNMYSYNSWCVLQDDSLEDKTHEYYFCLEGVYTDAVGHWMFECCVYLDLFKTLKTKYPNIKLVIGQLKRFKYMFLDYFDIEHTNAIYKLPSNARYTCIFPSPVMFMNNKSNIDLNYMHQFNIFWDKFRLPKLDNILPTKKYIIMPRQTKENYTGNNVHIGLEKIIEWFKNSKLYYEIVHTDKIYDLRYQMEKINSADTIILTDGSPYLLNGMFAYNKNIIIAGENRTLGHDYIHAITCHAFRSIYLQNKSVVRIPDEDEVIKLLQQQ